MKLPSQSLDDANSDSRPPGLPGHGFWRSLLEFQDSDELRSAVEHEFPSRAVGDDPPPNRREFWRLMSASLALAGITGCTRQPLEKVVPYVDRPELIVPGKPLFFATAMPFAGSAIGLLVESHMGRPTKVEGNPRHPASLGGTDAFAQASVLDLYDPDRSQAVTHYGQISSWISFVAAVTGEVTSHTPDRGIRLRLLTEEITSPTVASQIRDFLNVFPQAKWHVYEPVSRDASRAGAKLAFGEYVSTVYRFDKADTILSFDADFLSVPANVRYVHDFVHNHRVRADRPAMSRLYVAESMPTLAGAAADHRLPVRSADVAALAAGVASALGLGIGTPYSGPNEKWVGAVARDLQANKGRSLVIAGEGQPAAVHALAHAMNDALGNAGTTVVYSDPIEANPVEHGESLQALVADMRAGRVDALFILGANPALSAPADLKFVDALSRVKFRVRHGLYEDETSALCDWHIPETHYLESWGDARTFDGTVSIIQPLIAPLYEGKSRHEFLSALMGKVDRPGYDIVREYWRSKRPTDFDRAWRRWLHEGLIEQTALAPKEVKLVAGLSVPAPKPGAGMEVVFRPDPTIWDGRFANNAWLQELPKPLTKISWENAALMSPTTAERLGLDEGDMVELSYRGGSVHAPAWPVPGHADESITLPLGYGRSRAGRVGNGTGFNAYLLRQSDQRWFGEGLEIHKTGEHRDVATTQRHHFLDGSAPIRAGSLAEFRRNPEFVRRAEHGAEAGLSLYPGYRYEGYAWGMSIDLNSCIGCNACVVACQAENNIPVVGKEEVLRGREMHWIRIDTYHRRDIHNPETFFQPMLCQHCENAPCEVVCPVNATSHSSEGLNQMVYNRCVGTRYCSNNCPYKVRRFNFFLYSDWDTPSLKLQRNPDVTVRSRGVMEKCSYCVQRITAARIASEKEGRRIHDGEIVTACQQACPADAIVFGDINDSRSRVAGLKREPLTYGVLDDLNTRPRTTYLARVRTPNPELEPERAEQPHG